MTVTPKPAATVILMRESPHSLQTFLLKRHEASAFMGGSFVYPGGRMDHQDSDTSILPYCRGFRFNQTVASKQGDADEKEYLAHRICALRELFEEAGILLAYDITGKLHKNGASADNSRLSSYRRAVETKEISLTELAQRENLFYAFDELFYVDRWITPEARNIRFDTRFYLAFCPQGQQAVPDQTETVEGLWMSPPEALEANLRGSIALSPPALETLEMLSPFFDRTSLLKFLEDREPRTVLPILTKTVDGPVILFPWDEEYESLKGTKMKQPRGSRLRGPDEKTSRLWLKDGGWLPCKPEEPPE